MAVDPDYEAVTDLAELREKGRRIVRANGHSVALFYHEDEVYAVDNRCPHMGFPLSQGTVEDGILTCHWHHARFELGCGDTFDIWADDVQTYPTAIEDGRVYIDPDPEPDVPPATHWRNRLVDGMQENISLVVAKAVIGLHEASDEGTGEGKAGVGDGAKGAAESASGGPARGSGFARTLETAVDFGVRYREAGWGSGLTTLGAMANIYGDLAEPQRRRAMFVGVREVASDCAGEPPRFDQYALGNTNLSKARLKEWFRETCEVRDADGAERCLRTAIATLPPEDVAEITFAAATDHLYMSNGHTVDFINKAFETLEYLGWDHADAVVPATIQRITDGTRREETSSWRQPVDVAELVFDAHENLPELVAAGEGETWERPDGFVEAVLSDAPDAVIEALEDAIASGATTEQVASAVATAAMRRVAQFGTANEFSDWNTVHHTFSYANAVNAMAERTDAIDVYRGCFDGAMSVYLDRFLNTPPAPLPEPDDSTRDPADVREDLLDTFDEEGGVNEAGRLVSEHFDAGGNPADLKRTLGEGLLREDAGFHTLQSVEAGFRQFDRAEGDRERRLALLAPARYMAAHFPTRREREQTFSIAARLHRGEKIHEGA